MKFDTLIKAVAYWAEKTPDKVCLIDADIDRKITYGEFWLRIRIFAARLKAEGVSMEERIVVRVGPLIETLVAQFGIYLAGAVYCPVEKHMKPLKLREMLAYFDSTILISDQPLDFGGKWINLNLAASSEGEPIEQYAFADPAQLCTIVFTTGTMGKAKGVMLSYGNISNHANVWAETFGFKNTDTILWLAPLDRTTGIKVFDASLIEGGSAVHLSGIVFINDFYNVFKKYDISCIHLQSSALRFILGNSAASFSGFGDPIRFIIISAGATPEIHKHQLKQLLPKTKMYFLYGSTEISNIAYHEFDPLAAKANITGKPFPGTELRLRAFDNSEQSIANGDMGRVVCKNNGMMIGYWKDPELTGKTMIDGFIIMTDVGYLDDNGNLYLMGRSDDIIVSGGYKIAPYEIEEVVMRMEGISECACVPMENAVLTSVPKLFVVMKDEAEFSSHEILRFLSERIEQFKLPRVIRELDEMPRVGTSIKIDRKALRKYD